MIVPVSAEPVEVQRLRERLLSRAAYLPEALADLLEAHRVFYFSCFSILYFLGAAQLASTNFVWADEVLTAYLSRLDTPTLLAAL